MVHNDDTGMRVLRLQREAADQRTGVFTTGIVSVAEGREIALYFTGRQHAGENLADVLKWRREQAPAPIQMCDALSRNVPKLSQGAEALLANCLAHGRRQFVQVADNFPEECRYVLEMLGRVYGYDAEAKRQQMRPVERLQFHQQSSEPVMTELHGWLEAQLAGKKTEPNSGLGKAITYLLRHWRPLTLFLRQAGAPLDNNIVERALKRAVLHRKNALFYRAERRGGWRSVHEPDPYLSALQANSFEYLVELQRHPTEVAGRPSEWMPWNYRETLGRFMTG